MPHAPSLAKVDFADEYLFAVHRMVHRMIPRLYGPDRRADLLDAVTAIRNKTMRRRMRTFLQTLQRPKDMIFAFHDDEECYMGGSVHIRGFVRR